MWILEWCQRRRIERRIGRLTKEQRDEILAKSPYQAEFFQGEGYHVFLKNDPDY